jgi:serine/threonine protein kinase
MEPWKKGDRIKGRYEIITILQGGMGEVCIAYDHEHREAVAIKTLRDEFMAEKDAVERFIREAEIWATLERHKNIVRAMYVLDIHGKPHIMLEYVAGGDLRGTMKRSRLSIPRILECSMDLCRGMGFAYRKLGIVHRDIKPENCMITGDGVLKVTDFGIAAFLGEMSHSSGGREDRENTGLTRTGLFIGTIPYASPEQLSDTKGVDTRSDIYSFGIMLYEMLIGRTPFRSDDLNACINGHLFTEPPDPCMERNDIPRELGNIVLKCMAKEKEKRFQAFDELERPLQKLYRASTGGLYPEPEGEKALTSWELLNKGASLSALGRELDAIRYYDRALEINPRYAKAWFNKGASLFVLGRNDEALECNERALKINPRLAEAWSNKGVSLSAMGKKAEAIKCFDRALKINPLYDDALLNKGLALQALGRNDEALHNYERALKISPHFTMAWYQKGLLLSILGKDEDALPCYDRALELNPCHVEALSGKGLSCAVLGNYNQAIICYDRALDIQPDYAEAWANKVFSLSLLERMEEAMVCLHHLDEIDKNIARQVREQIEKQR